MLTAIVFDFDGIIADSERLHFQAFLEVLGPRGIRFDYDRYVSRYIGYDDRDGFRTMLDDAGQSHDDGLIDALRGEKAAAFERIAASGVPLYPGVRQLIEQASSAMPIALCSGALRHDIEAVLPPGPDGLLRRFSAMVTADDVTHSKPDPQSYRLAAERIGVEPRRCLAIEDTKAGLASARAAGLMTLAVTNTYTPDVLAPHCDRVVESLAEVSLDRLRQWYNGRV